MISDTDNVNQIYTHLGERLRRLDTPRWLSSRYAEPAARKALITLYAFYYELARIRGAVSDPSLGQIRYQWWRENLYQIAADTPHNHDLSLALMAQKHAQTLKIKPLQDMLDASEAAYLADDQDGEPERRLARIATSVVHPDFNWDARLDAILLHWSRLRRGQAEGAGPALCPVPYMARPALAHLRLRRLWGRGQAEIGSGRFQTRLCVLKAVLSGNC